MRHPEKDLFVGGPDFYPYFTDIISSDLFEDGKAAEIDGKISIEVKESGNKAWDIETVGKNLIYYKKDEIISQVFVVIHLARDVIAIESALGGCLQYSEENKRFELADCATEMNFLNQTFLITNEDGIWKGYGSYGEGWGLPSEARIQWGVCPTCIPGGFGSTKQGYYFDLAYMEDRAKEEELENAHNIGMAMGLNSTLSKLAKDGNEVIREDYRINNCEKMYKAKEYATSGYGSIDRRLGSASSIEMHNRGLPLGMAEHGNFHMSGIENKPSLIADRGSDDKTTETNNIMRLGQGSYYHDPNTTEIFSDNVVPLTEFRQSYQDPMIHSTYMDIYSRPTNSRAEDFTFDSFGNKIDSMDHHMDMEFDSLPTVEKKSLLSNTGGFDSESKNTISSMKKRGELPFYLKDFIRNFERRI